MSPMQWCFSDLVWQPLVIDAYLCLAMLHAWTLEYQHMMLCVWRWIPIRRQKANGQLEKTTGPPSQRLAEQGPGGCRCYTMLWRSEIARGHRAAHQFIRTTWWWWWRWCPSDPWINALQHISEDEANQRRGKRRSVRKMTDRIAELNKTTGHNHSRIDNTANLLNTFSITVSVSNKNCLDMSMCKVEQYMPAL